MGVFTETDALKLHQNVLDQLQREIGETLYPGDERRIFAEALTVIQVALFNTIDDVAKQNQLRYARGNILDLMGEDVTCYRMKAEKAITTLRYSMESAYTTDVFIAKGTRSETEDGHVFVTLNDAIIEQGNLTVDVPAEAEYGGSEYNEYLKDSIQMMVDMVPCIKSVTNIEKTRGGTDEESDEKYRERIKLATSKFSTAGTLSAYEYWTYSADGRIADVYINSPSQNNITISFILEDGTLPSEEIIEKVQSIVSADDVRPLGDQVTVCTPSTEEFNLEFTYYVSSEQKSKVIEAIEQETYIDANGVKRKGAIASYIEWQTTKIGRDINPDRLKAFLMNPAGDGSIPGATRVVINSPVYTELNGNTIAQFSGIKEVTCSESDDV